MYILLGYQQPYLSENRKIGLNYNYPDQPLNTTQKSVVHSCNEYYEMLMSADTQNSLFGNPATGAPPLSVSAQCLTQPQQAVKLQLFAMQWVSGMKLSMCLDYRCCAGYMVLTSLQAIHLYGSLSPKTALTLHLSLFVGQISLSVIFNSFLAWVFFPLPIYVFKLCLFCNSHIPVIKVQLYSVSNK